MDDSDIFENNCCKDIFGVADDSIKFDKLSETIKEINDNSLMRTIELINKKVQTEKLKSDLNDFLEWYDDAINNRDIDFGKHVETYMKEKNLL